MIAYMKHGLIAIGVNWWPEEINFWPSVSATVGFILLVLGILAYLRRFLRVYTLGVAKDLLWKNWVTSEINRTNLMLVSVVKTMPEGHRKLLVDYLNAQIKHIPMTSNPVYKEQSVMERFFKDLGWGGTNNPPRTEDEIAEDVLRSANELNMAFEQDSILKKYFKELGIEEGNGETSPN